MSVRISDKNVETLYPSFTVILKSGIRYDADVITKCKLDNTSTPAISFMCSGVVRVFMFDEVKSMELHSTTIKHGVYV